MEQQFYRINNQASSDPTEEPSDRVRFHSALVPASPVYIKGSREKESFCQEVFHRVVVLLVTF